MREVSSDARTRKVAALSLAVASALQPVTAAFAVQTPTPLFPISPTLAPTLASANVVSADLAVADAELLAADNETLRLATDQFKAADYEEAAATLSSIKLEDLSSSDRRAYDRLSARVTEAVEGRKAARSSFEKGEAALAENKSGDAIKAYKDAAGNKFADQATRTKSLEQIALAETQQKSSEVADRADYAEARELLKNGDLDGAKAKFAKLSDKGFKAGLFQRSPADYLAEISKKQAAPAVEAPKAAVPVTPAAAEAPKAAEAAKAPEAPAVPAGPTAAELYGKGVQLYRAGDFEGAKTSFAAAEAAGYKPGLFERSPADFIKRADDQIAKTKAAEAAKIEAEAKAKADAEAAAKAADAAKAEADAKAKSAAEAAAAKTVEAPKAVTPEAAKPAEVAVPAVPVAPEASTPAAKENGAAFYEAGVRQFREGNLDEAEKNFTAAKEAGYKPGLFQDSADKWLTRVANRRTEKAAEETAAAAKAAATTEKAAADARAAEARKAYLAGRDNYRKGDWIEARKNFVAANEAGYKPGLFEDSAQKYIDRMDKKESADAAKAQAELAAAKVAAEVPAAPVAPVAPVAPPAVAETPAAPVAPAAVTPVAPVAPVTPAVPAGPSAGELVAQARAAQAAGENGKALDLYTKAAEIEPTNAAALAGKTELGSTAKPNDILTEQDRIINGRRQVVQYSFDQAVGAAREAAARRDFDAARVAISQARAARNTDPTIFTPAELAKFDSQIALAQTDLDRAKDASVKADAEAAANQQQNAEKSRILQATEERQRTVSSLIKQARTLVEETKYREAVLVVDQILAIDPANDYALGVRPLIEDKAIIQTQRRFKEQFQRELSKSFSYAESIQVPYNDLLRYPENWPDITEIRDADAAVRKGASDLDQNTLAILSKRLPEIRFEGVAFGDVVDALRDITGANIFVDWKLLEQAGIDRTTPVTVSRLTNIRFDKALRTVLDAVSGGGTALDYNIDDGIIQISTREKIGQATTTLVYDVSDLLFLPLDTGQAPELQFQLEATTKGGGGGGGGNLFGGSSGGGQTQDRDPATVLTELETMIRQLVTPNEWQEAGGSGTIRNFRTGSSSTLIVTATRNSHRELDNLLNKLRASSSVQVTIEARFLSVSRNFLEDVGLDLDVTLNRFGNLSPRFGSRTGTNSAFVNNIPITQNSAQYTANPRTGLPSALSGTTTDTNPALGVQGTFLDDFSVDFLIRATQASVSSSTAQAPRLTLFSGQRARVIVGEYQFFVTDLQAIVGTGAVAFQPQPSPVFSGVELWVEAVVSSDRKYVQLNLVPRLRQLTGVSNFTFQTAATTTGGTTTGGTGNGFVIPQAGIATATVQLPTQRFTGIYTSASVPDGGTLFLGGLTQAGEVENEVGVPVLSKIPFLKRLFTNKSSAKDENIIMVLVKPTIIIQKEYESKYFPTLSSKVAAP